MEKIREYDKPRLTSTIIIGIFLLLNIIMVIVMYPLTWQSIEEARTGGAGDIVVAFALAVGIVLVIITYFILIVAQGIMLPFAIKNRNSTLKPVRIISYVYDGLIGAALIASIVKVILLFCGI